MSSSFEHKCLGLFVFFQRVVFWSRAHCEFHVHFPHDLSCQDAEACAGPQATILESTGNNSVLQTLV